MTQWKRNGNFGKCVSWECSTHQVINTVRGWLLRHKADGYMYGPYPSPTDAKRAAESELELRANGFPLSPMEVR